MGINQYIKFAKAVSVSIIVSSTAMAQDTSAVEAPEESIDEIIVKGTTAWEGHEGMDAFWSGDFEKAEFEFEKEFKSLRRAESARYNAAVSAQLGYERAEATALAGVGGGGSGGPGGGPPPDATANFTPDAGVSGNFSSRRVTGRNILNDGILTDQDFALTKYMAGLSELQLGKYEEAKSSFKRSIDYDGGNHDARMRLGLLYIVERNYDKAADQLEAIEKLRARCEKKECDTYDEILESAKILATSLTNAVNAQ